MGNVTPLDRIVRVLVNSPFAMAITLRRYWVVWGFIAFMAVLGHFSPSFTLGGDYLAGMLIGSYFWVVAIAVMEYDLTGPVGLGVFDGDADE